MADQNTINNQYCQSCGMPLRFDIEEYLGTNTDHSRSDEFCYYCLKDGEYIVDIPINQMIDIWVKYTDKYNEYASTNYSPQQLRILLDKRLPTLKRWRSKLTTQDIHLEAINRVKTYIDKNLNREITTDELAQLANISVFHFRRVFKKITGENIGTYIQRIRLQQIAHNLISTDYSINNILQQTVYQTKFSLAKAFKKHFGISMSLYRERHKYISAKDIYTQTIWQPEIKKLNSQKIICYSLDNLQVDMEKYIESWKEIIHYKKKYIKDQNSRFVSISLDNPLVVNHNQCRFYLGITTTESIKPRGKYFMREIQGGLYAVFRYRGNYKLLPELYRYICESWLPRNVYFQKFPMSFEVYLNTPNDTEISELLTEVYIPIEKQ